MSSLLYQKSKGHRELDTSTCLDSTHPFNSLPTTRQLSATKLKQHYHERNAVEIHHHHISLTSHNPTPKMVGPRIPLPIPKSHDPRPSRANEEARRIRKQFEKENPHFDMKEFGIKAGAIALLTALTLFPWEKEIEKHERTHHPERFQDEKDRGKGNRGRDDRRNDDRRRRRQSEGGERQREYRQYLDRDREYRPFDQVDTPVSSVEGGRYTGSDDGDYGRKYIEASRRERERADRRRRRGSAEYDYRRSSRDDRR